MDEKANTNYDMNDHNADSSDSDSLEEIFNYNFESLFEKLDNDSQFDWKQWIRDWKIAVYGTKFESIKGKWINSIGECLIIQHRDGTLIDLYDKNSQTDNEFEFESKNDDQDKKND